MLVKQLSVLCMNNFVLGVLLKPVGMWHAGICLVLSVRISSATNCTLGTIDNARGYLATFCSWCCEAVEKKTMCVYKSAACLSKWLQPRPGHVA